MFDEDVRLRGTPSPEDGACLFVDIADLIGFLAAAAEIGAITIVDEREDAAIVRDARFPGATRSLPGGANYPDLRRLLDVEGKVMDAEIGAVRAEILGGDRQTNGWQQRVARGARLRLRRG